MCIIPKLQNTWSKAEQNYREKSTNPQVLLDISTLSVIDRTGGQKKKKNQTTKDIKDISNITNQLELNEKKF